jgi:hypothetical protein
MQRLLMVVVMVSPFTACATDVDEANPRTSEQELEGSQIIGETFDELIPGPIGGQNGWEGDCLVVGTNTNKFLRCGGPQFATKGLGFHDAGSYAMRVDLGPNINVANSTHGRIAIDGPQGRVFQILVGCDNIRVTFQQSGPTLPLLSFPCGSVTGPRPAFRVVCNWVTGGTVLTCAASRLPADPISFVSLALPSGMRPFDRVSMSTFDLASATLFDNLFIWSNGGPDIPAL